MIILDTNVVSALMRPEMNEHVVSWLNSRPVLTVWITSITILETRSGLLMLPENRRRRELVSRFDDLLEMVFVDRVLSFDLRAAELSAALTARRTQAGRKVGVQDTQIAGIVLVHGAILATRNTKDFSDIDAELINPWS